MALNYEQWKEERGCARKRRYASQLDANTVVLAIWADGKPAQPYRCDYCDGWHITS